MDKPLVHLPIERYSKEYPSDLIFIPDKLPRGIFFSGESWSICKGVGLLKNNYFLKNEDGQKFFLKRANRDFSFLSNEVEEGKFEKMGLSKSTRFYNFVMFQKAEAFLKAKSDTSLEANFSLLTLKFDKESVKVACAQKVVRDYRQRLGKEISL